MATDLLPVGAYVRVTDAYVTGDGPNPRTFIGRVVGYDLGHSKYEIGTRYGGWGEWLFTKGGTWAFPRDVEQISKEEALRVEADR